MTPIYASMVPGRKDCLGSHPVMAPYDRSLIATVEVVSWEIADHALNTAYALFRDRDRWLKPAQRIEILNRAAALLAERAEDFAVQAAREGGKPLVDSRVEIARAIDGLHVCVHSLRTEAGEVVPMNLNAASSGRIAFTQKEPIGVVLAFSAFNHPLNLIVHQMGPAIAAGCPVIVKPAEATPISCYRFVALLREAGLPEEYCQCLSVENRDVSAQLVADPRVAFFSFIGSAKVGWMLRAMLAPGARCALEHGGAAPVIVAADADLELAIPLLTKGGFYHAGQVCVSVQRVFAHHSIAEHLARGLAEAAGQLTIGDPTEEKTEVGPLIRPEEVKRVDEWVQEAAAHGGQVLCGGKAVSETCYAPTVILDPSDTVRVSKEEVFGPVVCVYAYRDLDEAIARANNLSYAFQAAVFTRDMDLAMRAYRRLDAAAVMINDHTAFRVDWMPFAGLRQSGLGVGGMPYTMREMQIEKLCVLRSPSV